LRGSKRKYPPRANSKENDDETGQASCAENSEFVRRRKCYAPVDPKDHVTPIIPIVQNLRKTGVTMFVLIETSELIDNGYVGIVSQNGQGEVVLCNDEGDLEVFAVRDDFAGWCLRTHCGRVLEFCRKRDGKKGAIRTIKRNHPVREAFAGRSSGNEEGYYYSSKGSAINTFDGELQTYAFCLDRSDLDNFTGCNGSKTIKVYNEFGHGVGYAVLSWHRMESGRYEFIGYLV